mmetsp:Transcript_40665/g.36103  ORF Transcript_40665/g.36103 Transcript_40665/m.36103 type:complete len:83 (+) Transcript_40665:190-438(+)
MAAGSQHKEYGFRSNSSHNSEEAAANRGTIKAKSTMRPPKSEQNYTNNILTKPGESYKPGNRYSSLSNNSSTSNLRNEGTSS